MYATHRDRDCIGNETEAVEPNDPFEGFGVLNEVEEPDALLEPDAPASEPRRAPTKLRVPFSWAGFSGGLAALAWIAAAFGGVITYFGVEAAMAMDPAAQAGLIALAVGPALLFWLIGAAASEAFKARRFSMDLARLAQASRMPFEASEADARYLSSAVKGEIESLNEAVAHALDRMAELEAAAQRNHELFDDVVSASRDAAEEATQALLREREVIAELNGELKGNSEDLAATIGRQVRLLREASRLVRTEAQTAESAFETHVSSFAASANALGDQTAAFREAAQDAAEMAGSINGALGQMLEGLTEATRLGETARRSSEETIIAATETACAVRESTRAAILEARRAAQLVRAETASIQDVANDTLAKLQSAAAAARAASDQSAAAVAGQRRRVSMRAEKTQGDVHAWTAPLDQPPASASSPRHAAAKSFASWSHFVSRAKAPPAANEGTHVDFDLPPLSPDAALQSDAVDLVTDAGVDLSETLHANDLDRIARKSRDGASARRRAVLDAAPGAVGRVTRYVQRHEKAQAVAKSFRSRPDLTKSADKREAADLVRAYLLIDAALA
ncbi:MAG: hypothetical protein JNM59_00195 [Hyphomonadaceae bacterium]|nr:hypothetical protein [Hyphomonadaceae bacterium]